MKMKLGLVTMLFPLVLMAQNWEPNYQNALTKAKTENKPLLVVFSGSDWCAPCIKMDKKIWQSADFKKHAEINYVLYKADFPKRKSNQLSNDLMDANKTLAKKFNPKGHFPLVVLLDGNENVLGETGYKRVSASNYIAHLNAFVPQ
ncbi:thioredoxin family protein [Croceitalea sp. MTPC5]|uniref:thioredoxin family protein n=1 Tax=Croceitalea sp. MTPC5 TaxID=3056565 RepID=UPI0030D51BC6